MTIENYRETSLQIVGVFEERDTLKLERDELKEEVSLLTSRVSELLSELESLRAVAHEAPSSPEVILSDVVGNPTTLVSEDTEGELMDWQKQPTLSNNSYSAVRFLSRTAGLSGMNNVKEYMESVGINAKRMRLTGSTYRPADDVLLVNWGGGFETPSNVLHHNGRLLNSLEAIKIAANKLKTFDKVKENEELAKYLPMYVTTRFDAETVLPEGKPVYVRTDLYGHSGEGIVIIPADEAVDINAPLYVEGLNVRHEYRVHCVNGFTKIQKKARLDTPNPNMEIRNLAGGWTFINEFTLGDTGRSELHDISNKILKQLGLDFGAVDIVRTQEGEWKLLEVNTAPGISSPSNVEWYAKALLETN